LDGRSARRKK